MNFDPTLLNLPIPTQTADVRTLATAFVARHVEDPAEVLAMLGLDVAS